MLRRVGIFLVLVGLVLLPLSCAKIHEEPAEGEQIAVEKLSQLNAIPLKWGKLISVTFSPEWNQWQLWFQDESGNVRMVFYDFRTTQLRSNTIFIPQR